MASTRQRTRRAPPRSARARRAQRPRGRTRRRGGLWTHARRSRRPTPRELLIVAASWELSPTQREVLGWALCALGLFLGFVIYGGWQGGGVGHGLSVALAWAIGRARWLAPPALVAAGVTVLVRPVVAERADVALRPLRAGALCLFTGVLLALAAGTLGVSPGQEGAAARAAHATHAGSEWASPYVEDRGGVIGQALWWVAHRLVESVGVLILIAFLLLAGISLLSGASAPALLRVLAGAGTATITAVRLLGRAAGGALGSLRRRHRGRAAHARALASAMATGEEGAYDLAYPSGLPHPYDRDAHGVRPAADDDAEADDRDGAAQDADREPPRDWAAEAGDWGEEIHAQRTGERGGDVDSQEPAWADRLAGAGASDAAGERPEPGPADGAEDLALARAPSSVPQTRAAPALESTAGGGGGGGGEDGALTPQGRLRAVVTDDPAFQWLLPPAERVLARSSEKADARGGDRAQAAQQERVAAVLLEALGHFGVQAKVIGTVTGPHITRYELRLAPGIKVAKVAQLKDDLAYALAATDIRIQAPIPGKQAVGVEVPNARRRIVRLGDVFGAPPRDSSPLTVWLGKDVAGKAIAADLARMPHLLVAGATGSGKSGAINAMLSSVLLRASPHDVRLVLVDPKQVELNHYESIPHLLTPVITNPRMAANALANLVREMEQRYGIMSLARTRSLPELNAFRARRGDAPLPYILCVIDELADLMMVAPADVEDSIIRLAQKARAVGIHLVLATQSPRVDVITGLIKANVPSRIAFAVSSQTDSRVILDQNGAESLLGQGDMLFSPMGSSKLQRIQGAYIDEPQIARITDFWRRQGEPELHEELLEQAEPDAPEEGGDDLDPDQDPLLRDAITLVAEMQTASTSMMQRRLRVGYTRAGRLIDMLERRGVISGYEGSKPRQVLISESDLPRVLASLPDNAGRGADVPFPALARAAETDAGGEEGARHAGGAGGMAAGAREPDAAVLAPPADEQH